MNTRHWRALAGLFFTMGILVNGDQAWALDNGQALKPPMGWNGWYCFTDVHSPAQQQVTATLLTNVIETIATNGLLAAGYRYVNLDDCWQTNRDGQGYPVPYSTLFPEGISVVADHAHSKGMLFGIYYMAGLCSSCGTNPAVGSYQYELQDAAYAATIGADFMKFDLSCRGGGESQLTAALRMRDLVATNGRPMVFQSGGVDSNYWKGVCNQFRVGADIVTPEWYDVTRCLDLGTNYLAQIGPGSWPDPDMINLGNAGQLGGNLTAAEKRSYFGMWCMLPAALILSCDPREYSADDLALITHPEAIGINQDAAGKAMRLISREEGVNGALEVWCKDLGTGNLSKAVALWNRSTNSATMSVTFTAIGSGVTSDVHDVWGRTELGRFNMTYSQSVAAHDCVLLTVNTTNAVVRLVW